MPVKIDWYYHRPGCVTCKRSLAYLEKVKAEVGEQVNAAKQKFNRRQALALAREADEIIVAKGRKITTFDLRKDSPSDADLAAVILGPTGNLRAPALRIGRKLYIGFSEEQFPKRIGR